MIEFLKQHKLAITFVIVVIAFVVFLFRGSLFSTQLVPATPQEVALAKIKDLIINKKDCVTALPQLAALASTSPTFVDAWSWQGVCQFQMGKTALAKTTFEKVLSLDNSNESAKNYLKIISTLPAGSQVTLSGGASMSELQFESVLGFTPDKTKFTFLHLAVLPVGTTTESLAAFYRSSLDATTTANYFTSRFKTSSIKYAVSTQTSAGQVYATVTFTKPN